MKKSVAFIDGQNLRKGTMSAGWEIDFNEFKKHLAERYGVEIAYYFFGYKQERMNPLYANIEDAGFTLMFGNKSPSSLGGRDGDVDAHIVFEMMRHYIDEVDSFDKMVLVSGDGDFIKTVRYLILRNQFRIALLPNKIESSKLYKQLSRRYYAYLDDARTVIEYKKQNRGR